MTTERGSEPGVFRTLATAASLIDPPTAETIAARVYGLDASATPLGGETDSNFRLRAAGESFFLKVAHPAEDPLVVDLHTRLLQWVDASGQVGVQRVIATGDGEANPYVQVAVDDQRLARLTTFIEGTPLSKVSASVALREELGRVLGRLTTVLEGFSHPAADWPLIWDIAQIESLRPLLAELDVASDRALLLEALDRFRDRITPRLVSLPRQVVHNDFNGDNAIISVDGASVVGVVDFGDAVNTSRVNDLAAAMCNLLTDTTDPMRDARDMLRGYMRVLRLQPEEVTLLFDLTRTRTVLKILVTEWRARRFPQNRDYILRRTEDAWRMLKRMPLEAERLNTQLMMEAAGYR